jgi:hypothetical protein
MRRLRFASLWIALASVVVGCGGDRTGLDTDGGVRDGGKAGSTGTAGTTSSGAAGTTSSGAGGTTSSGAAGTAAGGASGTGACPALGCDPFCPNGVKVDAHGCPTCTCNPTACPAIACAVKCAYGVESDANGCPTCNCAPAPTCGPVCAIFCEYGNVLDAQGCPTCMCNPAPTGGACSCPASQVCVQQIGGPAVAYPPPPPACETPRTACASTDPCACLAASDGKCKDAGARTCSCDNGIR